MLIDFHERLRASEESRRRAWRVLEEIRAVLEILGVPGFRERMKSDSGPKVTD
jgi:hypothetical protein